MTTAQLDLDRLGRKLANYFDHPTSEQRLPLQNMHAIGLVKGKLQTGSGDTRFGAKRNTLIQPRKSRDDDASYCG